MQYKSYNRDILKCSLEEGWSRSSTDSNKGVDMPHVQKDYPVGSKLIDLVDSKEFKFDLKLQDAIKNRRTRRNFIEEELTLKELSFLLWATQGITNKDRGGVYRAAPSAGARHPFETYLVIRKVRGLALGIYRYLPLDHKLYLVTDDFSYVEKVSTSCFEINKIHMEKAAVVFIWAVVPYRAEWRFGSNAYKYIALDAGHVCQNLYLAVEAIGAGTCAVVSYNQKVLDELIRVNGKDEFVIYLAPVGKV